MSTPIKLSDIQTKANENYANTPVELPDGEIVTMRNALQLTDEERKVLTSAGDVEEGESKSQLLVLRDIIRVTVEDKEAAERLINAVGDNLAFLVELFKTYNEGTQSGEA